MRQGISRRRLLACTIGLVGTSVVGCGAPSRDRRVVWQQDAPGESGIASLAANSGTLYAGSHSPSGGALYAFDAATGTQRWEYDGDTDLFFAQAPTEWIAPVCDGDTVYALANPAGSGGGIHAVDASSGRRRWVYPAPRGLATVPSAGAGSVFTGVGDTEAGGLIALDRTTGIPRWTLPTAQFCGPPAFAAGVVYAGDSTGNAYAVDAMSGKQLWQIMCAETGTTRLPDLSVNRPVLANGLVYFAVQTPDDQQPMLYALRADTGQAAWTAPAPRRATSLADLYHGPFLVGSTLCLPNNATGTVYGLDAATGTRRWQSSGTAANDGASCVADAALLTGCRAAALSAMDGASGVVRWQFSGSGPVGAGPVVAGGIAYVGTASDGPQVDKLYALRL
ncbi:MAG TPA: PQQ-binding-like beta-propeller repeat protein [Pseudonocardiaceae bacterium]|jgi:outer membrane protein assembly factor BamB